MPALFWIFARHCKKSANTGWLPSNDVVNLWGDLTKAKARLCWNPAKTSLEQRFKLMVEHSIAKVAAEGAAAKVRTNLAEYLEKGIVK